MTPQSKNIVDFNFHNIEEDQFLRRLARVTTTVVSIHSKQKLTIQKIYNHVEFKYGDITKLHVPNSIFNLLICCINFSVIIHLFNGISKLVWLHSLLNQVLIFLNLDFVYRMK